MPQVSHSHTCSSKLERDRVVDDLRRVRREAERPVFPLINTCSFLSLSPPSITHHIPSSVAQHPQNSDAGQQTSAMPKPTAKPSVGPTTLTWQGF